MPGTMVHLVLRLAKTFATSNYRVAYLRAPRGATQTEDDLFSIVRQLISAHCTSHRKSQVMADSLADTLRAEARSARPADFRPGQSMKHVAMLLWTSAATGGCGVSLFGILQDAIRQDLEPAVTNAAQLARCINELCVDPRPPPGDDIVRGSSIARKQVYRGGGFASLHQSFFHVGVKYRIPMYLATSLRRDVAEGFMRRDRSADKHVRIFVRFSGPLNKKMQNLPLISACLIDIPGNKVRCDR
jgi:hypothetical protein